MKLLSTLFLSLFLLAGAVAHATDLVGNGNNDSLPFLQDAILVAANDRDHDDHDAFPDDPREHWWILVASAPLVEK